MSMQLIVPKLSKNSQNDGCLEPVHRLHSVISLQEIVLTPPKFTITARPWKRGGWKTIRLPIGAKGNFSGDFTRKLVNLGRSGSGSGSLIIQILSQHVRVLEIFDPTPWFFSDMLGPFSLKTWRSNKPMELVLGWCSKVGLVSWGSQSMISLIPGIYEWQMSLHTIHLKPQKTHTCHSGCTGSLIQIPTIRYVIHIQSLQ